MDTQTAPLPAPIAATATVDAGIIRLGAAMRGSSLAREAAATLSAASVADTGRIRLGAAMRLPGRRHG